MLQVSAINGALSDVSTSPTNQLGSIFFDGANWYKYVNIKNTTATVAGVDGTLVAYFAATGKITTNSRVVIDLSDADALPYPAGALMGTVAGTLTVDYYGWIQIKGPKTLDTAVTSGAAGTGVILTTTDKTASVEVAGSVSKRLGTSINATTLVNLDCDF